MNSSAAFDLGRVEEQTRHQSVSLGHRVYVGSGRISPPTGLDVMMPVGQNQPGILDQLAFLPERNIGRIPAVVIPQRFSAADTFIAAQEWEGNVVEIMRDAFKAKLVDLTRQSFVEEEEAEIDLEDVSLGDRDLVKPGAIFRWVVGYDRTAAGTVSKASRLIFRRLPAWTERDLASSRERARALLADLKWE